MCLPLAFVVSVILSGFGIRASNTEYAISGHIKLGGDGGWDCLAVDPKAHRLYVTRGSYIIVVDLNTQQKVGEISNLSRCHGVALDIRRGRGFISSGGDSTVVVFDLKSLKEITRMSVGSGPDIMLFDPYSNRVFSFNGGGKSATAIDAETLKVVGEISLPGKPEFAATDGKGKIYVNIEDKSEICSFESKALKVNGEPWPLAPGVEPTGLALDVKGGRLFSACSNGIMAITDIHTGKVVASPKIGQGADGAGFDPKYGLAFSSNGRDGSMSIVGRGANGFERLGDVATMTSARTMVIDPSTHRIYISAAKYESVDGQARPQMVKDSFEVLVLSPKS